MRFLANENFPYDAVVALRDHGDDVAWIRIETPGLDDEAVLARAQAEARILITFDFESGPGHQLLIFFKLSDKNSLPARERAALRVAVALLIIVL